MVELFLKRVPSFKRDYERYSLNDFIKNSFNIEVLDLTSYNNPDYNEDVKINAEAEEIIFTPSGKKEILEYIKRIDQNSIIISLSRKIKKLFYIQKNYKEGTLKSDL